MKKGFVLSISTFMIIIFLVSVTSYYQEKNSRNENSIAKINEFEKAILLNDDISTDLNKILGVSIDLNSGETQTAIKYKTKLPTQKNISRELLNLQKFYDANYSLKQNALFATDFNKIADGKTELTIGETRIDYDYDNNKISFVSPGQSTKANQVDINVNIDASSTSKIPWDWNASGEITVNLIYQDQNALNNVNDFGKLSAYQLQEYVFSFSATPGDEFKIAIGNIDSNYGSLEFSENIIATDAVAKISTNFTTQNSGNIIAYYDADLNYILGNVIVNKKIEIARG